MRQWPTAEQTTNWRLAPYLALGLAALTVLLYLPVLGNGFVNFDDPLYVTENTQVRNGLTVAGLSWAVTAFAASNWHPLTWLSHMLDVQLFGLDPMGHHLVSVLGHGANTLLLFLFLRQTTGALWRSFFAALLFAVHPLHVESVAWIAERKDVLCGLFWLLTLLAYTRYARSGSRRAYVSAVGWYAAALLSKPMAITIPLILFILDYWPLRRLETMAPIADAPTSPRDRLISLIRDKLPFCLLAAIAAVLTITAQTRSGAVKATSTWGENLAHAVVAYGTYLVKMVWPGEMVVLYPYVTPPLWQVMVAAASIVAISVICWRWRDRRYLLAGWLWYLIALLPVSGIVRIGEHAVADRYTYLPLIGPFIMICWGLGEITAGVRRARTLVVAAGGAGLLFYAVASWHQMQYWRDSVVLLRHAVTHTTNNWMACHNLGLAHLERWETAAGLKWLQESIRINPSYATAHNSLGIAYGRLGAQDQAIAALREAVRLDPAFGEARYNLVRAYVEQGNREAAFAAYQQLRTIDRQWAEMLQPLF